MTARTFNVLILCMGNGAKSNSATALSRHRGGAGFGASGAGGFLKAAADPLKPFSHLLSREPACSR